MIIRQSQSSQIGTWTGTEHGNKTISKGFDTIEINLVTFQMRHGEISSDLYRASRCDIEKQTFLYIDFYQNFFYSLFAFHFLMIKNLRGKL